MTSVHFFLSIETVFIFLIIAIIAIFINLFMHRHAKSISLKKAIAWSIFWIVIAIGFGGFLYVHYGKEVANLFFIAYSLEVMLSIDNLFLIMAIFTWFDIHDKYRSQILYWGVIGAIFFRGIFIIIGTILLKFIGPYVEVFFALIVSLTAIMMLKHRDNHKKIEDYSQHLAYRLIKRFYPIWPKIIDNSFFLSQKEVAQELKKPMNRNIIISKFRKSNYYATPLLLCVSVVEFSDLIFAFDSVPAIMAVSREPLIIYSAMIFAILGLRTLYFVLERLKQYLIHLEKSAIILLFFVAFKLGLNALNQFWYCGYSISNTVSLFIILGILIIGILASLFFPEKIEENKK